MKNKNMLIILLILFSIILLKNFEIVQQIPEINNESDSTSLSVNIEDYESTPPIIVFGEGWWGDFSFPGNGTLEDPYIIENYFITASSRDSGIYITYTTSSFIIRNCLIIGCLRGIYLDRMLSGQAIIVNNTIKYTQADGIMVIRCSDVNIYNNTVVEGYNGISIGTGYNITIEDNFCSYNLEEGLVISGSNVINVRNNSFEENFYHGCFVESSYRITLEDNVASKNRRSGITVTELYFSKIHNNSISNNLEQGLVILYSQHSEIIGNYVENSVDNGMFCFELYNTTFSDNVLSQNNYSGMFFQGCEDMSIFQNNFQKDGLFIFEEYQFNLFTYEIENNTVNGKKLGYFVDIESTVLDCSDYGQVILVNCMEVVIELANFSFSSVGVSLLYCDSCRIIDCIARENDLFGIFAYESSDLIILGNNCSNTFFGDSINLLVCLNGQIKDNICNFNEEILAQGSGIKLTQSSDFEISNNTCNRNMYGIRLESSTSCEITYNHLQENLISGVYLDEDSSFNNVHHNRFIDNNDYGINQAHDFGSENLWYDPSSKEGNHWNDLKGKTYEVGGDAGSIDKYPMKTNLTDRTGINILISLLSIVFTYIFARKKKNK